MCVWSNVRNNFCYKFWESVRGRRSHYPKLVVVCKWKWVVQVMFKDPKSLVPSIVREFNTSLTAKCQGAWSKKAYFHEQFLPRSKLVDRVFNWQKNTFTKVCKLKWVVQVMFKDLISLVPIKVWEFNTSLTAKCQGAWSRNMPIFMSSFCPGPSWSTECLIGKKTHSPRFASGNELFKLCSKTS